MLLAASTQSPPYHANEMLQGLCLCASVGWRELVDVNFKKLVSKSALSSRESLPASPGAARVRSLVAALGQIMAATPQKVHHLQLLR